MIEKCSVSYAITDQWPGGFLASVKITNTGTTTIQNWTLTFIFPGQQQISRAWNGQFTQNGQQVTITSANFNNILQPGQSTTPGFQATVTGKNKVPSSFSLNGVACN